MTSMRHISVASRVFTGDGVSLCLQRAVCWQGQEQRDRGNSSRATPAKQAKGGGVKAEVHALENRT